MRYLFNGARLVIVAASARDTDCHFLKRTKCIWQNVLLAGFEHDIQVSLVRHHFCNWDELRGTRHGMPVIDRAWCFQEYLNARRCLVFQDDEVVWECRAGCKCECRPGVLHNLYFPTLLRPENLESAERLWLSVVQQYSARRISVPTNCLPAFAAIAEFFKSAFNSEYLAELWAADLIPQLAWDRRVPVHASFYTNAIIRHPESDLGSLPRNDPLRFANVPRW